MKNKIGYGIIGLGVIAEFHLKAITDSSNGYAVGCYDALPGKVAKFAEEHNIIGYSSLEELLSNDEIKVVTIATPSGYHLEPALKAIERGKHVIIEKPLEITGERCDLLINAAKSRGVKLTGVFQSRFNEAPRLIKAAIEQGRFGKIAMINAEVKWWRDQAYYDSGAWRGTLKVDGGGALMNQSIHAIDLLCWFGGDIKAVSGMTSLISHERIEVEDTGAAVLKFKNGALGIIEGSTGIYPGFLKRLEILGSDGSAVLEEDSITTWSFREEKREDQEIRERLSSLASKGGGANDPKAITTYGHQAEFEDFANAILNNTEPFISALDAARAVRVINAIYQSAKERREIELA